MKQSLSLADLVPDHCYMISGFKENSDYSDKLHRMGFVEGTIIKLAPVKMFDPIVFEIRASRIALRRHESKHVLVKEI